MLFKHFIGKNGFLNHHLDHGFNLIILRGHGSSLLVLHRGLHHLELLFLLVEEDLLGLLLGQGQGCGSSQLRQHELLLSLFVLVVVLVSDQEFVLSQAEEIHDLQEKVRSHALLLLNHLPDELTVLFLLASFEEGTSLLEQLSLLICESLPRILHHNKEQLLVVVKGQATGDVTLGLT